MRYHNRNPEEISEKAINENFDELSEKVVRSQSIFSSILVFVGSFWKTVT